MLFIILLEIVTIIVFVLGIHVAAFYSISDCIHFYQILGNKLFIAFNKSLIETVEEFNEAYIKNMELFEMEEKIKDKSHHNYDLNEVIKICREEFGIEIYKESEAPPSGFHGTISEWKKLLEMENKEEKL